MSNGAEKSIGRGQIERFAKEKGIDPQTLEAWLKSGEITIVPSPKKERRRESDRPQRTGGGKVPRKQDADGNPT